MAHGSEAHPPELIDLVHEHDGYSLIGLYEFAKLEIECNIKFEQARCKMILMMVEGASTLARKADRICFRVIPVPFGSKFG